MASGEPSSYRIVVAEDDPANARLFREVLAADGHDVRLAADGLYALALADEVGVGAEERATLRKGALLHDLGKISIPDAILDKPAALTADEFEVVKQHTIQGARIVEPLQSLREAVPLIRSHHER